MQCESEGAAVGSEEGEIALVLGDRERVPGEAVLKIDF